jgi:hypothetical protein
VSRKFAFVRVLELALRALMVCEGLLHPAVDPVDVFHVMDNLVHVHSVETTKTAAVKTVFNMKCFLEIKNGFIKTVQPRVIKQVSI